MDCFLEIEKNEDSSKIHPHNDFFSANLIAYIGGISSHLLLCHARYNFTRYPDKGINPLIATLNVLSTIRGANKGRVGSVLGTIEGDRYDCSLELLKADNTIILPQNIGASLILEIIRHLPKYITHLNIPIAQKAQKPLEEYYMNKGARLREAGKISEASYYGPNGDIEGVSYRLQ